MTWLVIAPVQDLTARWAADRLTRLGVSPIKVITDAELARAAWNHQLGDDGVVTQLIPPDGRLIDCAHVQGTLNRLPGISWSLVAGLSNDDRMYAFQEINALLLSFLNSLPGPMLNPPDPRGLCGAWRRPSEWCMLASEAGLDPVLVRSDIHQAVIEPLEIRDRNYAPGAENVIVVGGVVFATDTLNTEVEAACCKLAELAATPLLGITLEDNRFAGASPLPELRAGGDDLISALAEALEAR